MPGNLCMSGMNHILHNPHSTGISYIHHKIGNPHIPQHTPGMNYRSHKTHLIDNYYNFHNHHKPHKPHIPVEYNMNSNRNVPGKSHNPGGAPNAVVRVS